MIMLGLEAIVTSVSRYDLIDGKECWAVGTVNLLVWVSNRVGNGGVVAILISYALQGNLDWSRQICHKLILLELCEVIAFLPRSRRFHIIIIKHLMINLALRFLDDVCGHYQNQS